MEVEELTSDRAVWMFALLCFLQKPIDEDVAHALRSLLRRLCQLRTHLVKLKTLYFLLII